MSSRVITPKGYAILKSSLTTPQTDHLVKELTVKPKVIETYARGVQSFPIYMESPTRFYVPRQWGITTYGEPEAITIGEGYRRRSKKETDTRIIILNQNHRRPEQSYKILI